MTTALAGTAEAVGAAATQAPPADHSALALALGDGARPRAGCVSSTGSPRPGPRPAGLPDAQPGAVRVGRPRPRPAGPPPRRRRAGAPPPRRGGPGAVRLPVLLLPDGARLEAPSRLEAARAVGLPTRPARPEYDLAIVGGRAGRPDGRGVRRLGGAAHGGARARGAGGPGRGQRPHRELPRLPAGDQRPGADRARLRAGAALRGRVRPGQRGGGRRPGGAAPFRLRLRDGAELRCPRARRGHGGGLPPARGPGRGGAHRAGHLLRLGRRRGVALPRAATCSSSGAGTRPGRRRCTWPGTPGSVTLLVRGQVAGRGHVRLPDPGARGRGEPHGALRHRGGRRRGARAARGAGAARPGHGRRDPRAGRRPGPPDRAAAAHRLGGGPPRARRAGLPAHRPRPAPSAPAQRRPAPAAGGRCRAPRSSWRRACPACSPPATCATARPSASPRPWGRARWRCSSCTSTSASSPRRTPAPWHGAGLPGARPGHTPLLDWSAFTTEARV